MLITNSAPPGRSPNGQTRGAMKALTVTQPWATLIAIGAKRIETRSWPTAYRGPLAIHAAAAFPKWAKDTCVEEPFLSALYPLGYFDDAAPLPTGEVIATCCLVNVRPTEWFEYHRYLSEREQAFGDYSPGRYAWMLEDVKMLLEPVPATGARTLWEWA